MKAALESDSRWHLYRRLGDPTRLRMLALAAEEELGVGELAELSCSVPCAGRSWTP